MKNIINEHTNEVLTIKTIGDTFDSPLLIINPKNDRAFICSSVSDSLNQQLINTKVKVEDLTVKLKQ